MFMLINVDIYVHCDRHGHLCLLWWTWTFMSMVTGVNFKFLVTDIDFYIHGNGRGPLCSWWWADLLFCVCWQDINTTRYHVVIPERLLKTDLRQGGYKQTLLGFSFQLRIHLRDGKVQISSSENSACEFWLTIILFFRMFKTTLLDFFYLVVHRWNY